MQVNQHLSDLLVRSIVDYAILALDLEGRIVSWNPGAERIKGYQAEEILGEHFSRFYTPEDQAAGVPQRALRMAAETGRFAAEGWRVRKDGTRFWAIVVIDPIYECGKLVGFAKITRDMTEQRAAHLAALETERRFRLLVHGVTDYAIFMLDTEGRVTNWNAGAARIKGYTEQEILGEHFSRFYLPEDVEARLPWRALEKARQEGRYEAEGWRRRKDGTRFWASVVVDAIHDETGGLIGFAKITRDLTERRQAQLELERSREQLVQVQKMEAIGQLTGGLAHDFNNLLTGISGSLELLQMRIAAGRLQELDRYIASARAATSKAAALTHRLLAFARRQTLDPAPTSINRLVAGMTDLIGQTTGPGITLQMELSDNVWPVLCDQNQMENALLNLCINGKDAMQGSGRLTLTTEAVTIEEQAGATDLPAGDYVAISVSDTGSGMPPDVMARAFEPFFTTKGNGKGTGLGLSMVYGFARQSGGAVQLLSEVGSGTTVRILLPRYHGALNEREADVPPVLRGSPVACGETVLVVDDEPTVRMVVMEALSELGYAAIEAADAASALKVLESNARIDLLITDVGLPSGMDGREMADVARQRRPALNVLFITGYADRWYLNTIRLAPGMHLLTKPFEVASLRRKVAGIFGRDYAL